ncbi:hypothetical protein J6590_100317 [Homalodisca vitripennis]|nr:hypothetical protein J6590_100317 [Homalodisca vitripennis]
MVSFNFHTSRYQLPQAHVTMINIAIFTAHKSLLRGSYVFTRAGGIFSNYWRKELVQVDFDHRTSFSSSVCIDSHESHQSGELHRTATRLASLDNVISSRKSSLTYSRLCMSQLSPQVLDMSLNTSVVVSRHLRSASSVDRLVIICLQSVVNGM